MGLDGPILLVAAFAAGLAIAGWVWLRARKRERLLRAQMTDLETETRNARDTRDAVGEVIGSMTQRVLGPLQNIAGYGRALEQSTNLSDAQRALASAATEAGRQVEQVLGDALNVSLSTTGSLTIEESEVDLREVMDAVARSVRSRCVRKQLKFSLLIGPDLPRTVITDAVKLRYILQNMVSEVITETDVGAVTLWAARFLTPTPGNTEVRITFEACGGESVRAIEPGSPRAQRLQRLAAEGGVGLDEKDPAELTLVEQFVRALDGDVIAAEAPDGALTLHAEIMMQATEPQSAPIIELDRSKHAVLDIDGSGFFGAPTTDEERLVEAVLDQQHAN